MYYVQLDIRPTGGLTFRRMPSSILHISTYPFLPPSTMSGYLRRLLMLGAGRYPNTTVGDAPYYVLPWPLYHVLGAYPIPRRAYRVHKTYRQGIRDFKHTAFSRLVKPKQAKQDFQLHTWEYLFVERLRGYVASEEIKALEKLHSVVNLGSKLGKEGYAYIECTSEVLPMERKTASAIPSVLTPASELVGEPADFVFLYRHEHTGEIPLEALADVTPSPVAGFVPFWGGWPAEPVTLDYWTDGQVFIPAGLLEVL
jgi:CRISPR/Cas system-associated protein Cas5 (RAMP superfamily)